MAYFFPQVKREIFQKTFLKDVHVSYLFNEVSPDSIDAQSIRDFYKRHFNLTDVNDNMISGGMLVNSDDKLIQLEFTPSTVGVKMKFPAYKSFDFALLWLPIMNEYMSLIGIKQVTSAKLWKYNELQYNLANNPGYNAANAMEQIFSHDLLSYTTNDGTSFAGASREFGSLSRWEKNIVFEDKDDSKSRLTVEYGFSERPEKKNEGSLTMKTYIETSEGVEVEGLIDQMKKYNDILDRAFYWCIDDSIVKKMRTK